MAFFCHIFLVLSIGGNYLLQSHVEFNHMNVNSPRLFLYDNDSYLFKQQHLSISGSD